MKNQAGFTFLEIMVSMLLGLIILSATINIYVGTVKGSTDTINASRLNHDLEMAMSLMMNDIKRAGYWGGAVVGVDSSTNPFTQIVALSTATTTDIQFLGTVSDSTDCLVYTYDADGDGLVDTNEFFGFKLRSGSIKILTGSSAICTGNSWSSINVLENVYITAFTYSSANYKCLNVTTSTSYTGTCAAAVTAGNLTTGQKASESRQIDLTLTGRLVSDTSITKSLTGTVKVRNDRIFTQ